MTRTYTELLEFDTMEGRFDYLSLGGVLGDSTFGFERYINQGFYHSREWRSARSAVIARDNGCELGLRDYPVRGAPRIHHMNPLTMQDIEDGSDNLLDPEGLITVSLLVHNAIHYGDRSLLPRPPAVRRPGDTVPWR